MLSILRPTLLSIIALCFIFISQAQAKPEKGRTYKDWTVVCEESPKTKKKMCNIFQNVTNDKGKVAMQIAVGYPPEKTTPQALITLPLGVLLPPGVEFLAGSEKATRAPFGVCINNGCIAIVQLDDTLIKGMKGGSKGGVKFVTAQQQVIEIPISLSGFTAAFNSLKK
ncbi:MAG: invasion associated locus B family protein [Gammaproteobacteria bacterium]|nr:invasion associated locus B family protein [Gammaproteobacteria bacterium]